MSPYSVISELVEDSFDEDATRVIVTVSDEYVVVEDDAGMNEDSVGKFLVVGSTHKQLEPLSPRFGRARTGRYGVGRMSFLAFFNILKVRTQKGTFSTCFVIDEECLGGLSAGTAEVKLLNEPPLGRDGSEIWLQQPKSKVDPARILVDLRELPILREPYFEVWFRAGPFIQWNVENAEKVKPREVMGEKVPFKLEDGIVGEITIAYRPLTEREKGILIMHGGHAVTRSNFNLSPSELNRITGWVRCDWISTRFADKAAIIEDASYERFTRSVRKFLLEKVVPRAVQVEKGMTYEESRIFMEMDRLLSKVIMAEKALEPVPNQTPRAQPELQVALEGTQATPPEPTLEKMIEPSSQTLLSTPVEQPSLTPQNQPLMPQLRQPLTPEFAKPIHEPATQPREAVKIAPMKREVSLSKLGLRAAPYDDETDEREFFVEENVVYVNRGHPAYQKELKAGRDVLRRHILRIVASALASLEYPELEALEYANKLIAEAIKRL